MAIELVEVFVRGPQPTLTEATLRSSFAWTQFGNSRFAEQGKADVVQGLHGIGRRDVDVVLLLALDEYRFRPGPHTAVFATGPLRHQAPPSGLVAVARALSAGGDHVAELRSFESRLVLGCSARPVGLDSAFQMFALELAARHPGSVVYTERTPDVAFSMESGRFSLPFGPGQSWGGADPSWRE